MVQKWANHFISGKQFHKERPNVADLAFLRPNGNPGYGKENDKSKGNKTSPLCLSEVWTFIFFTLRVIINSNRRVAIWPFRISKNSFAFGVFWSFKVKESINKLKQSHTHSLSSLFPLSLFLSLILFTLTLNLSLTHKHLHLEKACWQISIFFQAKKKLHHQPPTVPSHIPRDKYVHLRSNETNLYQTYNWYCFSETITNEIRRVNPIKLFFLFNSFQLSNKLTFKLIVKFWTTNGLYVFNSSLL